MLIVQLSDLHIMGEGRLALERLETTACLEAAVDAVNALVRQPDLVVITGDITEDGTPDEYDRALPVLRKLHAPLIAIPGNHDERGPFRAAFQDFGFLPAGEADDAPILFEHRLGGLRIIGLDSTVPGHHQAGFTKEQALDLKALLEASPGLPTLLLIHHPPCRCHIDWMDIPDPDWAGALKAVVEGRPEIVGILSGHVHRSFHATWAGTTVSVAPSTAHQLTLEIAEAALPRMGFEPPGFLQHVWDGQTLTSHTTLVGPFPQAEAFTSDAAAWAEKKAAIIARGTLPKDQLKA